jgi:hypothetical protein
LLRYDIPHTLNLLWTLDLPFGSGNLLLLQAPNTLDSGVLFTKFKKAIITNASFETGLDRGDYDPRDPNRNHVYQRSAFALPGQFEFGSASRYLNDFRNPSLSNENIAIIKRTRFRQSERIPLEFEYSANLFNPFNRTQFGNIQPSLTATNFGQITGPMVGPRIITMGLRLNW